MVIQVYASTSHAEEAEVERFYEDLEDLLELTPEKDVLFIIGDWNAKDESQETPGVTSKFGLGMRNEVGQRLIEFCLEKALVIAKPSSNTTREDSTHGHHQKVNNKMGKTRDLFKKIRDPKGIFHAKMGSIDRNGMDLTEAEDIKMWQEYTEELYKKDLHDPDNHNGVISHLDPDILECEVKWALASLRTKLLEVMEFQLSYFKS